MKKQQMNPGIIGVLLFLRSMAAKKVQSEPDKTLPFTFGGGFGNRLFKRVLNPAIPELALYQFGKRGQWRMKVQAISWDSASNGVITPVQIASLIRWSKV